MEARHIWALMLVVAAVVPVARGIWLVLPSTGVKCVSEELHNNVVVLAGYYSFYSDQDDVNGTFSTPPISVKVSSPHGNDIHHKENVTHGEFGFTTTEPGSYVTCFWVDGGDHQVGRSVTVGFEWKTGIATKDWDSIAKKEKIEGLDLEFRKLEYAVQSIHEKMDHIMTREWKMRVLSEKTNASVARYSIMSLGLCVFVSVLQLWYLRRYFHKKKLI